mgnify:CR=1 FL=1
MPTKTSMAMARSTRGTVKVPQVRKVLPAMMVRPVLLVPKVPLVMMAQPVLLALKVRWVLLVPPVLLARPVRPASSERITSVLRPVMTAPATRPWTQSAPMAAPWWVVASTWMVLAPITGS